MSDQGSVAPQDPHSSRPEGIEEKSLSAALLQAANDAKDVGLGYLGAKLYDATKPKDPPKGN
jgi:hypothetical protein